MIDMKSLLVLQGQLFLLMAVGVFFRRYIAGEAFQKGLTDLIIDLVLPCNILLSFRMEMTGELFHRSAAVLVISCLIQLGCSLLAALLYRRCKPEQRPVLQYGTISSNAGFLGTPVAEGVFGPEGVLLAAVFLIPQRIFMWSLGVSYFTRGNAKNTANTVRKALTHPCIVAVVLGIVLMLTGVQLPEVLEKTLSSLGACNTGLSMLLIGMIMHDLRLHDFFDPLILCFSAVRLLLIPFLVFTACRVFHAETLASQVALLLGSMPAAGTTAVLASKYGGDTAFAAGCVTVTTVLSLAAIPLWCLAMP